MEPANFILWSVLTVMLVGLLSILLTCIHVFTQKRSKRSFLWSPTFMRWSGLSGILGGLLFIVFEYFYFFTHGTSQVPRNATLFGLSNLQYYQMSIIWQLLILFALAGIYARYAGRAGRLGSGGSVMALLGITMLVVSTVLQVYIVDPDRYFYSFPVQGGWMLQLLSYPVYAIGMVLLSIAALQLDMLPSRSALMLVNGLLPLLSLMLKPYAISLLWSVLTTFIPDASNSYLMGDILSGTVSVPYGLSWVSLGYVIARTPDALR